MKNLLPSPHTSRGGSDFPPFLMFFNRISQARAESHTIIAVFEHIFSIFKLEFSSAAFDFLPYVRVAEVFPDFFFGLLLIFAYFSKFILSALFSQELFLRLHLLLRSARDMCQPIISKYHRIDLREQITR